MKVTRRLKITVTRHRVLRTAVAPVRAFCPVCAREVETFSAAQSAVILQTGQAVFNQLLAAGRLHALATVNGELGICRDSLFSTGGLS